MPTPDPRKVNEVTLVVHPDRDGGYAAKLYVYHPDGKWRLRETWYLHEFIYQEEVGMPWSPQVLEEGG
jgi:hypothetical protein